MRVASNHNAEHYTWPSAISEHLCDGWHLHRSATLSIIEERMPPDTAEQRHLHQRATQFFYVLAGELILELDGEEHCLTPSTGLTVPAQTPHQVFNRGREDARFLVVSQPSSHGDREPARAVIDEKGQVVARVMGEARDEDVRAPLDWLLQGHLAPPPPALLKRY